LCNGATLLEKNAEDKVVMTCAKSCRKEDNFEMLAAFKHLGTTINRCACKSKYKYDLATKGCVHAFNGNDVSCVPYREAPAEYTDKSATCKTCERYAPDDESSVEYNPCTTCLEGHVEYFGMCYKVNEKLPEEG